MTREDYVLAMFAAANPVPDADALMLDRDNVVHLGTAEQMESTMADTQPRTRTTPTTTTQRRPWLMGAAAAVIVLVVGAGLWAAASTDDNHVATATPDTTAQVEPEVAAVLSAIEAYNAGDREAWAAAQATGTVDPLTEILMNANDRIEVSRPCRITSTTLAGDTVVSCDISARNDFHGAGGIVDAETSEFTLNDQLKISNQDGTGECCTRESAFNRQFWLWLVDTHPDVYDQIRPIDLDSLPGWERDPADMSIAIQYADEFVAQSEDYPLDPSNS